MAGGISDNTGADARGGGDEIGDTFEERALAGGIAELDWAGATRSSPKRDHDRFRLNQFQAPQI